jgi:hypothetical protein
VTTNDKETDMRISPAAASALAKGDLADFIAAATPGGIEAQEAGGQRDLTRIFATLPKDMDRAPAEAFGFSFGEDADDIFVNVTAPAGWSLRPTDHSMWSDIVDDHGRKRGSVFYKAAFYDRNAHGTWSTRYRIECEYGRDHDAVAFKALDAVTGATVFTAPVLAGEGPSYERREEARGQVSNWLAGHFPGWDDVTAYWVDKAA